MATARDVVREAVWFAAATALPMAWMARNLTRDLWYDEVYTLFVFAARPIGEIVRDYSAPNNHVAFTLLVKPVLLFSTSEWAVRLPSFLAAIAALALVYRAGLRAQGRETAVLSAASLALCQMFQNFAVEVRGYALSMALVAGLVLALVSRPSWRRSVAIATCTALVIYTIPTNAFVVLALAVSSLFVAREEAQTSRQRRISLLPWFVGVWIALVLYLPLWEGLRAAREALQRPPLSLGWEHTSRFLAAALADEWAVAILACAGWLLWLREAWRPRASLSAAVAVGAVLPFVMAGLLRLPLYVRLFSPLLPVLALGIGSGLAQLGRTALPIRWIAPAGLLLLYAVSVPRLVTYDSRLASAVARDPRVQDGYFHFYAADFRPHDVARWLADHRPRDENYAIAFAPLDHFHLQYYLFEERLPENNVVARGPGKYRGTLFLVSPEPLEADAIARHYAFDPAELRRFERAARIGYFSIYFSPPDFELTVRE